MAPPNADVSDLSASLNGASFGDSEELGRVFVQHRTRKSLSDLPSELLLKVFDEFSLMPSNDLPTRPRHLSIDEGTNRKTLLALRLVSRLIGSVASKVLYEVICPTTYGDPPWPERTNMSEYRWSAIPVGWGKRLELSAQAAPSRFADTRLLLMDLAGLEAASIATVFPLLESLRVLLIFGDLFYQDTVDLISKFLLDFKHLDHLCLYARICEVIFRCLTDTSDRRTYGSLAIKGCCHIKVVPNNPVRVRELCFDDIFDSAYATDSLAQVDRTLLERLEFVFSPDTYPEEETCVLETLFGMTWPALRSLDLGIGINRLRDFHRLCNAKATPSLRNLRFTKIAAASVSDKSAHRLQSALPFTELAFGTSPRRPS